MTTELQAMAHLAALNDAKLVPVAATRMGLFKELLLQAQMHALHAQNFWPCQTSCQTYQICAVHLHSGPIMAMKMVVHALYGMVHCRLPVPYYGTGGAKAQVRLTRHKAALCAQCAHCGKLCLGKPCVDKTRLLGGLQGNIANGPIMCSLCICTSQPGIESSNVPNQTGHK